MGKYFKNLWLIATNKDAMHLASMAKNIYLAAMRKEIHEGFVTLIKKDGTRHKAKYKIEPISEELKMTDIEKLAKENGFIPHEADDGECYADLETLKQFAEAYTTKVLEDKEREIAELREPLKDRQTDLDFEFNRAEQNEFEVNALKEHNNDLREALEGLMHYFEDDEDSHNKSIFETCRNVISKTPAQSLQAFENEVIEKCAKVCDEHGAIWVAKSIRALKATD